MYQYDSYADILVTQEFQKEVEKYQMQLDKIDNAIRLQQEYNELARRNSNDG